MRNGIRLTRYPELAYTRGAGPLAVRLHDSGLWSSDQLADYYGVTRYAMRWVLFGELEPSPWAAYVDAVVELAAAAVNKRIGGP